MNKYNKVTDMQVLETCYNLKKMYYSVGIWEDFISAYELAKKMQTSEYQIRKAYNSLKEKGYMKLVKYPIYFEEYDNGLYTENIPILYTKVYMFTDKGKEYFERKVEE